MQLHRMAKTPTHASMHMSMYQQHGAQLQEMAARTFRRSMQVMPMCKASSVSVCTGQDQTVLSCHCWALELVLLSRHRH